MRGQLTSCSLTSLLNMISDGGILPACNFCLSGNGLGASCSSCTFQCRHCVPQILESHPNCQCGSPWNVDDPVSRGWVVKGGLAAKLVTLNTTVNVTVYYRPCTNPNCGHQLQYDGQHDGIFNLSNQTLFTYETMFDYWDGMTVSRQSFTAQHAKLRLAHQRTCTAHLLPSRQVIRYGLQCFLNLLDVEYQSFGCPCCSHLPHDEICLVGDGTTLGFRKDFAQTASRPPPAASPPIPDR
jgi:hypothetical protein